MRTPKETFEKYMSVGKNKTDTKATKTFLLAIMAGIFIAFAGAGSIFAGALVNKVCAAFVFCGGLSMVLVAGSELFTGNCLLIMPLMDKKVKLCGVIKNLVIVYIGNFIGSLIISFVSVYSGVLDAFSENAVNSAVAKTSLSFGEALLRGILCNILVCIAVWMSFSSDKTADKIIAVIFPVSLFVLCGFEHSIANMFFIPTGMLLNHRINGADLSITVFDFIIKNLIPVTIGNIIGGSFVGAVYYFVFSEKREKSNGKK